MPPAKPLARPALYNEIEPAAAHVLRQVMADGVIAPGTIDTRSIKELKAHDVRGFTQAHFFAGGGLWSVAARLAGWPDDWPLWTASCPCQPFSQAGRGAGFADERHLWPDLLRLVDELDAWERPPVIVGEQVAGQAGYDWFDRVRVDLGERGYQAGVVNIPAAAVDAPHIRQRLYWAAVRGDVADVPHNRQQWTGIARRWGSGPANDDGHGVTLGDAFEPGLEGQRRHGVSCNAGSVGCKEAFGSPCNGDAQDIQGATNSIERPHRPDDAHGSFWADHEWLRCHDGKARRTKPRICMLANEYAASVGSHFGLGPITNAEAETIAQVTSGELLIPSFKGRTALWKIAGNAIVPELAAQVLAALKEVLYG